MLLTIILAGLLVGLDRWLKVLAVQYLAPIGTKTLLPGVIGLRYIENDGAAFSMLAGRQGLLIAVTGVALAVVAYILLFRRPNGKFEYVALVMVFAGGAGNLIDRIASGFVVDYIEFLFVNFAIFNLADILVCVGFAILAVAVIASEQKNSKMKKEAELQEINDIEMTENESAKAEDDQPDSGAGRQADG